MMEKLLDTKTGSFCEILPKIQLSMRKMQRIYECYIILIHTGQSLKTNIKCCGLQPCIKNKHDCGNYVIKSLHRLRKASSCHCQQMQFTVQPLPNQTH